MTCLYCSNDIFDLSVPPYFKHVVLESYEKTCWTWTINPTKNPTLFWIVKAPNTLQRKRLDSVRCLDHKREYVICFVINNWLKTKLNKYTAHTFSVSFFRGLTCVQCSITTVAPGITERTAKRHNATFVWNMFYSPTLQTVSASPDFPYSATGPWLAMPKSDWEESRSVFLSKSWHELFDKNTFWQKCMPFWPNSSDNFFSNVLPVTAY